MDFVLWFKCVIPEILMIINLKYMRRGNLLLATKQKHIAIHLREWLIQISIALQTANTMCTFSGTFSVPAITVKQTT
jgi:hypothetical protein